MNSNQEMKKERNNNIILIMAISLIIVLVGGGTMAWLSWSSENNTAVSITVTGGTLTIDGGGDITSGLMAPTEQCNHENYSIQRTITASAINGTVTDMTAYIQLYTNSTLFPNVYKMENLEWVISSSTTDCSTSSNILASGNFANIDNSSDTSNKENTPLDLISFSVPAGETINKTYYLYIWVNEEYTVENVGDTVTSSIQDVSFTVQLTGKLTNAPSNIIYREAILNGADPVLDDGMIPVTISENGVATTVDESDSSWYSYENKEWANVVLVDSDSRSTYLNTSGVTVSQDDILAYYVWVPRYKYQIWTTSVSSTGNEQTIDIVFENKDTTKSTGTQVGEYLTHPAFTFGDTELNGIWVGKFESSGDATTPTILPNVQSLRNQNVSTQFQTSLKFAGGTLTDGTVTFSGSSTYGLTSNTDSHIMKNSEWGAVAYLSHSKYGINSEIYINNSSGYYTGRSGGNVGGSVNTLATQFPDNQTSTYKYNSSGYYTWTGQAIDSSGTIGDYASDRTLGTKASTTGNVTGVYDMSGGSYEYVMGVLSDSNGNPRSGNYSSYNSGFNGIILDDNWENDTEYTSGIAFPDSKYYDLYLQSQFGVDYGTDMTLCTLDTCGGHALNETAGWYSDYADFVGGEFPWFKRGGYYYGGVSAGAFDSGSDGGAGNNFSWRSVLVVGAGA